MNLRNSWLLRLYIVAAGILYLDFLSLIIGSPFTSNLRFLLIVVIPFFLVITTPIVLYKLIKKHNTIQSSDAMSKIEIFVIVVPIISLVVWYLYKIATIKLVL